MEEKEISSRDLMEVLVKTAAELNLDCMSELKAIIRRDLSKEYYDLGYEQGKEDAQSAIRKVLGIE